MQTQRYQPIKITATGDLWDYEGIAAVSVPIVGKFVDRFYPLPQVDQKRSDDDRQPSVEGRLSQMYKRRAMWERLSPSVALIQTIEKGTPVSRSDRISPRSTQAQLEFIEDWYLIDGSGEKVSWLGLNYDKSTGSIVDVGIGKIYKRPFNIQNSPILTFHTLPYKPQRYILETVEEEMARFADELKDTPDVHVETLNLGDVLPNISRIVSPISYTLYFSRDKFWLGRRKVSLEL